MPAIDSPINPGGDAPDGFNRNENGGLMYNFTPYVSSVLWGGFGWWLRKNGHPYWGMFFLLSGVAGIAMTANAQAQGYRTAADFLKHELDIRNMG